MTFSTALCALKDGRKVTRSGWNGKGMWLELQKPDTHSKMTLPYIYLNYPKGEKYPEGARVPWLPSQTDVLADDWEVIEEEKHDADHSEDIIIAFLDALIDNIPVNESKCLACDRKDKCARWQKYVKEHTPSIKVEQCAKGTVSRKTEAKDKDVESK